jgi:hypothetical protein
LGEFIEARQQQESGIAKYTPGQRHLPVLRIAQDLGVGCRSYLAWSLWFLGFPDQALARAQDGLALALELKHPFSVVFARCWLANVLHFRRDVATLREQAETALAQATEQGFPIWVAMATISRGWALAMQNKGEGGVVELAKGIAAWRATGAGAWLLFYFTVQAEALDLLGKAADARQKLDEAQAAMEGSGDLPLAGHSSPAPFDCIAGSGGNLVRARPGRCPPPAGQITGTARRHQPRPPVVRAVQARGSASSARARYWLVY